MAVDTITVAVDADGKMTRIEDAVRGDRYTGASKHHERCELYPVFRTKKRASYAHMPKTSPCPNPNGESEAHRQTRVEWYRHFKSQTSGCLICIEQSDIPHLDCPIYDAGGAATPPMYGCILWWCTQCGDPHIFDLLGRAGRVISDQKIPGIQERVRPDITVLDDKDGAVAVLEFRRTNLSSQTRAVAEKYSVPLFVIDVLTDPEATQSILNNPERSMWDYDDSMTEDDRRWIRESNSAFESSVAQDGGSRSSYETVLDDDGRLVASMVRAYGQKSSLPTPSYGRWLVAHESTHPCLRGRRPDSQSF